MEKSEVRILIVEDDPALGEALLQLFKRAGYSPVLTATPEKALLKADHQEFHVLIVDCMLPKMNGVDLAQKLVKHCQEKPILILMTGIFKDKAFIKDAMDRTGALTLLSKPFQLPEVLALVEKELKKGVVDPELSPFLLLLTQQECTSDEILHAIAVQRTFHGLQLPLILSLLARQGITGDLNIVTGDRQVSQITLIDGRIVDVKSQNPSTQLGELLVEFGFAMIEDVEAALTASSDAPIGKRMIDASMLSPHAVRLIREEQLVIRLSQLVANQSMEVTWIKRNVEMRETFHPLPPVRLKALMSEWIISKIPSEWLRTVYLQFSDRCIVWRGKAAVKIEGAKASINYLPTLLERVTQQPTLQDLMNEAGESELDCLQAVHTLVLERKICFGEKRRTADDFNGKIDRYRRLLTSFTQKDFFEVLGVGANARSLELQSAFTDLAKQFHPDKVAPDSPPELVRLSHEIFARITNAYETLSSDTKRKAYLSEQSRKEASRLITLEPLFDEALNDLKSKKYSRAMQKFDKLRAQNAPMPDLNLYYFWAKIKAGHPITERDFFDIPPERRHSGLYSLVRGLFYRSVGKYEKAMESLQHARLMDKNLREAHSELLDLAEDIEARDKGLQTLIYRIIGSKPKKKSA